MLTPYKEITLIREGNAAAAVSCGGVLVGLAMPLAVVAAGLDLDRWRSALWGAATVVVQLLVFRARRHAAARPAAADPGGRGRRRRAAGRRQARHRPDPRRRRRRADADGAMHFPRLPDWLIYARRGGRPCCRRRRPARARRRPARRRRRRRRAEGAPLGPASPFDPRRGRRGAGQAARARRRHRLLGRRRRRLAHRPPRGRGLPPGRHRGRRRPRRGGRGARRPARRRRRADTEGGAAAAAARPDRRRCARPARLPSRLSRRARRARPPRACWAARTWWCAAAARATEPVLVWAETGRTDGLNGTLGGPVGRAGAGRRRAGWSASPSPRRPRRGRIYTTAPETVGAAPWPRPCSRPPSSPTGEPITVDNYGRVADDLRRDLRVAQVVCLPVWAAHDDYLPPPPGRVVARSVGSGSTAG